MLGNRNPADFWLLFWLFCILKLTFAHKISQFWGGVLRIFCVKNHVVYKQKHFQLFPVLLIFIYLFIFHAWLTQLGFLALCWVEMISYLSYSQSYERRFQSLTTEYVRWRHVTMSFIILRWSPSTLDLWVFVMTGCWICQTLFVHLLRGLCDFYISFY